MCEQLAQARGHYLAVYRVRVEPVTSRSPVRHAITQSGRCHFSRLLPLLPSCMSSSSSLFFVGFLKVYLLIVEFCVVDVGELVHSSNGQHGVACPCPSGLHQDQA